LLSVVVAARAGNIPGLLLLGDAAHPMSPIRAQASHMAFDVVGGKPSGSLLHEGSTCGIEMQAQIQDERKEIEIIQQLKVRKRLQAERPGATTKPASPCPQVRPWLDRQRELRQG